MSAELLELGFMAAVLSAFLIGLSFGSGPCNLSCLPYLGPVLLGPGAQRPFTAVVLPFMTGRLVGYFTMGVTAALLGSVIKEYLAHPVVPIFAAIISLWLALKMWRQAADKKCATAHAPVATANNSTFKSALSTSSVPNGSSSNREASLSLVKAPTTDPSSANIIASDEQPLVERNAWQLAMLGFSLALNQCIPLLGLLAAAAQSADPIWGGMIALSFGLGAIVIPSLLVRYGVALLGRELRSQLAQWQVGLTRTGALMLVLVAVNTAWRGIPA
ncbi:MULTISPECIES: sulfite exporter TauE/SafE family protein [unclassified Neptuniibacter]|uniref:urease accessory protein UreH domain-containing protein n=1 Tax=unclassified Neptuniibacter TaxID=2630693 RepID=UPI0025F95067|nr:MULTISPECIES: sulfite exporter TauE/SafE family protein [unclassified Neptuniibacter]|tara:strand:- start:1077 stop:1898 length:822 start_codon:yes stop_codon:yes gene_type:complete